MDDTTRIKLLWVDDEIEHLKPHIFFLKEKGFQIETATNGKDAIGLIEKQNYNLIFLDENMPGLSGLETLTRIKELKPNLPVIMVTKSEEESIMDQAIGSKIADYLIKPVNPNQIWSSIKKTLARESLISKKATTDYQSAFSKIGMRLNDRLNHEEWREVYKNLVFWELELQSTDSHMNEVLLMQKNEANNQFTRFVKDNYTGWLQNEDDAPLMSHTILKKRITPLLKEKKPVVFIVVDNFRYDQWEIIQKEINPYYTVKSDELYFSILPTATQFCRNSIFAGLLPSNIAKIRPDLWVDDDEEGSKNQYEEELLNDYFKRTRQDTKVFYEKINNVESGKKLLDNYKKLKDYQLSVVVVNFVDMLSHARTEMKMFRELISDESSYRSLTLSWFRHSPLFDLLKKLSQEDVTVVITTDHGTIRVQNPLKVVGDKNVNTNLRFKQGKNLAYDEKDVFEVKKPEQVFLPKPNVSTTYIFATGTDFFAYPNNYNYYVSYYKDTFQHGGISMEEMMIPFAVLEPVK
ncbi:T9SS response regulator signal transducer PorX [Natronoflexus pectinivorans]|uniref:Response regulator receiver domain-containing protein n=1 Tax=Natronoflexus pectinivorans TaxID=682526 RepID=A0A4R2GHN5_9BACT|nr:bifunctional response regulator/alkaline phosphatase family protein [Natronoflexus pectinivorans]TCO07947.1 response regulator receiver domain-containing protein [Natronoflexus pectinivorans]